MATPIEQFLRALVKCKSISVAPIEDHLVQSRKEHAEKFNKQILCSFCTTVFQIAIDSVPRDDKLGEKINFHDIAAIRISAERHCGICSRLWQRLSQYQKDILLQALNKRGTLTSQYLRCCYVNEQRRSHDNLRLGRYYITMTVHFERGTRTSLLRQRVSRPFSTDVHFIGGTSDFTFPLGTYQYEDPLESEWDTIQSWLTKCNSEHSCVQPPQTPWFPTRVLDVGVGDH